MIFYMLAACTSGEVAETAVPDLPASYDYEPEAPEAPAVSLEELEATLQAALSEIQTLHAAPLLDVYFGLIGSEPGDPCPVWIEADGSQYWNESCTTGGGLGFSGWAYHQSYEGLTGEHGESHDLRYLSALAWVSTESGEYEHSGTLVESRSVDASGATLYGTIIEGNFAWTGDGVEGTWVEQGLVPDLVVQYSEAEDLHHISIEGGVSGYDGAINAIAWNDVRYVAPSMCEAEPQGTISFRDAEGQWIDVTFIDSQTDPEGFDFEQCDGCGVATWRGQELGEVCADFTALLEWTEQGLW